MGGYLNKTSLFTQKSSYRVTPSRDLVSIVVQPGPAGPAVKPLELHVVNVGSIPTGLTHGEVSLQPHPGDVLKSTPKVRKSPRSGLNLEWRLSDPRILSP